MESLVIRKANITDAKAVASLARITFKDTFGHLFNDPQDLVNYFNVTFSQEKIAASLQKSNNVFWLALFNDKPVGYAKLKVHSPSEFISDKIKVSQLQKIYILQDYFGQQIGQKLQDKLFEEIELLNSKHLWLSVYIENPRAIGFYKKHGFTTIGSHTFSIGKETFEFTVMDKTF